MILMLIAIKVKVMAFDIVSLVSESSGSLNVENPCSCLLPLLIEINF